MNSKFMQSEKETAGVTLRQMGLTQLIHIAQEKRQQKPGGKVSTGTCGDIKLSRGNE